MSRNLLLLQSIQGHLQLLAEKFPKKANSVGPGTTCPFNRAVVCARDGTRTARLAAAQTAWASWGVQDTRTLGWTSTG